MPDPLPAAAAGSSVCEASGDVREGRGRANSCCCTLLLLKMPAQPAARCISWQRSDRQRQRKQKGQAREAFASAGAGAGAAAAAHPPACVAQCDLQSRSPAGTGRAPPRSLQAQGRAGKRQAGRQARGRQAGRQEAGRQAGRQAGNGIVRVAGHYSWLAVPKTNSTAMRSSLPAAQLSPQTLRSMLPPSTHLCS